VTDRCCWESLKVEGATVAQDLKKLLHEGNVRRVIVTQHDRVVVEFPLTAGVVGVAIAPVVAGVAAIVALLKECTIHIERASAAGIAEPVVPEGVHP